jgi:hypothetical protein
VDSWSILTQGQYAPYHDHLRKMMLYSGQGFECAFLAVPAPVSVAQLAIRFNQHVVG